jgi:hypothetical protein
MNQQPHRTAEFKKWNKVLRDIGKNRGPLLKDNKIDFNDNAVRSVLNTNHVQSIDDLMVKVFDGIENPDLPLNYFKDRAILAPKNIDVTSINNRGLKSFLPEQTPHIYTATNTLDMTDPDNITELPVEILNKIEIPGKFYFE